MDENAYKDTYRAVNPISCSFEKAILTGRFGCEKSARAHLAERVTVGCCAAEAREGCARLLELLRENAMFALKLTHSATVLPHGKEMRVQCGGLMGVRDAVWPEDASTGVGNIFGLVAEAEARFNGLEGLPFREIVKSIAAYQLRHRPGE
jgi:hypothetical protein